MPKPRDQSDPRRLAAWEHARRLVGARIRELRIANDLTQEQLALQAGFSRNLLVDVELGKSGLLYERLFDLAVVLGVAARDLLAIDHDAVYDHGEL